MSLDVNISEPDEFNCIELHNCIKSVADIRHIEDFTYHVDLVSGKGENYIANVFRVCIQETGSDKNLSVIVKTLVNTTRQELFRELHKREVLAYKEVIDKFVTIQNSISIDNRIVLPECIFSSLEKNNEVIILEDLLLRSFMIDSKIVKFEKIDYPQACLVITELAKFHGLSFVLAKRDENFETTRNNFEDLIYKDSFLNKTKLRNYFSDSFQMSLQLISDNEIRKKLDRRKEKLLDVLRMYTKPRKYSVFCHGDCWINNILFKEDVSGKEICFIDFQAMRYASPVTDILYFLYICTDSEFRSKYFTDIKTAYYNTLKSYLDEFEIEAYKVYPREEFENDLEEILPFGLLVALTELRLVTTTHEDIMASRENLFDIEAEDTTTLPGEDILYQTRVNDVINESVDNGVLQRVLDLLN